MLIETDSPFLAPPPHRGKRNEPAYVKIVAQTVADVLQISVEEVANQTTQNFFKLFNKASETLNH
jgi:TatD DNase family protein